MLPWYRRRRRLGRWLASVACIACNVSHRPRKITLPPPSISESGRHHKSFAGRRGEAKVVCLGKREDGRKGGAFLVSCFILETSEELWTYDFARCLIGLVSCRHKFVFFSVRELVQEKAKVLGSGGDCHQQHGGVSVLVPCSVSERATIKSTCCPPQPPIRGTKTDLGPSSLAPSHAK